jgi:hypothetical protein
VATGRGDLARPRRRSRFEDSAPAGLVDVHDELDAARPSGRPVTPVTATAGPASSAPDASGERPAAADGRPAAAPGGTAAAPAPRPGPEPADPLRPAAPPAAAGEPVTAGEPRASTPVTTPVTTPTETRSWSAAPATTEVTELHHHVEQIEYRERHEHVEHHEHRHDTAVTQLFQWIDAAADARVASTDTPITPREQPSGPRRTDPTDRRRDAPPAATVVSIGRIEIRTVRPAPPARHRTTEPAPLDFAGPTLEEFLGGRP